MSEQIIIISDIHTSQFNKELIYEKFRKLPDLIAKEQMAINNIYIVCAGDIANAGKKEEYEAFMGACKILEDEVKNTHPGYAVRYIFVPGNHDADWNHNNMICNRLIKSNKKGEIEFRDFYHEFVARFDNYFEFEERITGFKHANGSYWVTEYDDANGFKIRFNLYNTAVYSGMGIDKGYLQYPTEMINNEFPKEGPVISIGVMHHPFDWFKIRTNRELAEMIMPELDILVTGHDHANSYSQRINESYNCLCVETDALEDAGGAESTGVISIYINKRESMGLADVEVYAYSWLKDEAKFSKGRQKDKKIISLKDSSHGFELNEDFKERITRTGETVSTNTISNIHIEDLFVYPSLEKVTETRESDYSINSVDLLSDNELGGYCIICGDSKSGKSALANKLFLDLWKQGNIPLILNYEKGAYDSLDERIKKSFEKEYDKRKCENYFSIDFGQRAIIIDNYNFEKKNIKKRLSDLLELKRHAAHVIVFISSEYSINLSTDIKFYETLSANYAILRIAELNRRRRRELITKWTEVTRDATNGDYSADIVEIIEKEKFINGLFSGSLVPKYPIYVIMFMSAMQTINSSDVNDVGTYGSLYELVIKAQLARIKIMALQDVVGFLSEFAYYMYKINGFHLHFSQQDYTNFASSFNKKFEIKLATITLFNQLINAGIFIKNNDSDLEFCHNYFYYYFIANYLSAHSEEQIVAAEIRSLCVNFYDKHQANIWLFLTHISNKDIIVDTLLEYSNSILSTVPEIKFEDDIRIVESYRKNELTFVFEDKDYEQLQSARLEEEDRVEKANEAATASPLSARSMDDPVVQIVQVVKTIEALGQLIRNFIATLDASKKQLLLEAIYRLTFRAINYVKNCAIDSVPEYIRVNISSIQGKPTSRDMDMIYDRISSILYYLIVASSLGVMNRAAVAVANKSLQPSFETIHNRLQGVNSYDLLYYLINLQVSKDISSFIPDEQLSRFNKHFYCRELIKFAAFLHIYLYVDDHREKQRLCDKYNILYRNLFLKQARSR